MSSSKLKAVVKAVPYLEKFIRQLCQFLHECEHQASDQRRSDRVAMEDVLPILKRYFLSYALILALSTQRMLLLSRWQSRMRAEV
jgi:hypothetical protein